MTMHSVRDVLQVGACHDLIRVFPKDAPGPAFMPFQDRIAKVAQQPGKVSCLRNKHSCRRPEPTDAIDRCFLVWAIRHVFGCRQIFVKPIYHIVYFSNLPRMAGLGQFVERVKSCAKDALVAARVIVAHVGFKSDVHKVVLRNTQTFLSRLKTQFGCQEPARCSWAGVSRWLLQRNSSLDQSLVGSSDISSLSAQHDKSAFWKLRVQHLETTL